MATKEKAKISAFASHYCYESRKQEGTCRFQAASAIHHLATSCYLYPFRSSSLIVRLYTNLLLFKKRNNQSGWPIQNRAVQFASGICKMLPSFTNIWNRPDTPDEQNQHARSVTSTFPVPWDFSDTRIWHSATSIPNTHATTVIWFSKITMPT